MRHSAIDYPPGPTGLRSLDFLRTRRRSFARVAEFLTATAGRYGAVSHWRAGPRHFYLIDDPPLIEELLVTRARDFMKGIGAQRLRLVMGEGLVTSEPPLHLRQRRMMQPAFHRERIAAYAERMIDVARARAERWNDGEVVHVDAQMAEIALEVVVATMFGSQSMHEAGDVRAALAELQPGLATSLGTITAFIPTWLWARIVRGLPFVPSMRAFLEGQHRLDAIIYRLIDERGAHSDDGGDLLSMLLAARDENGAPMDRRQIHDEAMTIFLAGHETTAIALSWTWYLLARHPEVEANVYEEVKGIGGDRDPTPADVPKLAYVRDVIAESMRLYPPVWNIVRRALRDTALGDWRISKEANVIASPLVTHRNPAFWRHPRAFRPERWTNEARDLPKFAYFPFGGGNRVCIGESFAWTEAILVLATIARRWRLEPIDRTPIPIEPMVTLRPARPMLMRARQWRRA